MRQALPETDAVPEIESKVTVLTWPSSYHFDKSTRHSALSEGHSALRTYRGGPNGKGVYVSFWPGENKLVLSCGQKNLENKDDPSLCHQNISHFHSPDDDDLAYRNYPNITSKAIELEGLNVEIINKLLLKKKNKNYNGQRNIIAAT